MNAGSKLMDNSEESQDLTRQMIQRFIDNGFEGSVEKTAIVLGRPEKEINSILEGEEVIDDDLLMKMLGIAHERNIEIE